MTQMEPKLERLRAIVKGYESALVCFSGGVDSTFLLAVAADVLGERCHAVTAISETMARSEREDAVRLGAELGLGARHVVVESHELAREGFKQNPTDRCYMCKTELLEIAGPLAERLGADAILLGTNVDDLGDHRPGLRAADERGAVHPMVEAGLTKADVRAFSRALGLRTWNKPQLACLSSRFPYGTEITPERLERVDRFEEALRALGFGQLRVRFHDAIARLELDADDARRAFDPDVRARLLEVGKELGFTYVAIDLAGYRTGAMNEVVKIRRKPA